MKKIRLTKGKFAIVDDEDFEWASQFNWQATWGTRSAIHTNWYAGRRRWKDEGGGRITMHRELMKPPPGMEVDHINHDGLDNRRSNLRVCTKSQNSRNAKKRTAGWSRHKGVCFDKRLGRWVAMIYYAGSTKYLGSFESEVRAAAAYALAAKEMFGEFACAESA